MNELLQIDPLDRAIIHFVIRWPDSWTEFRPDKASSAGKDAANKLVLAGLMEARLTLTVVAENPIGFSRLFFRGPESVDIGVRVTGRNWYARLQGVVKQHTPPHWWDWRGRSRFHERRLAIGEFEELSLTLAGQRAREDIALNGVSAIGNILDLAYQRGIHAFPTSDNTKVVVESRGGHSVRSDRRADSGDGGGQSISVAAAQATASVNVGPTQILNNVSIDFDRLAELLATRHERPAKDDPVPATTESEVESPTKPRITDLTRWAIAFDGSQWWLFKRNRWLLRPGEWEEWQQQSRFDPTPGRPSKLLLAFAENGGRLSNDQAVDTLRLSYPGKSRSYIKGTPVRDAINDLRGSIRGAVAAAAGQPEANIPDPIETVKGDGRRAVIAVGFAQQEETDSGQKRLVFRQKEDAGLA